MRLFNTLTRQEEEFRPLEGAVRMYTCGLTVYARGHVGNFRTFVALDVLRRVLKYEEDLDVRQVMNFTDVDDRTIAAAAAAGMPLREYTDAWIAAFRQDAASLGLEPVEANPRATDAENLQAMCDLIAALEARGHTYRSDGSIYFKIATFPAYGRLARLDHAGIKAGARIDSDNYQKENARDFVLWKATRPGEPTWNCGIGPGRPGWHIECSAMARRVLGDTIDIHAGGVDLIFPHHENEIAQSEGATGQPFARFWVHVEHLLMDDGEKMSKSVGNVFTVSDVLAHGYRASALRYLLMSVHYRKQLKFSWASLDQAEEALKRLMDVLARLDTVTSTESHPAFGARVDQARAEFKKMVTSDVNVPGALGVIFDLVRAVNVAIDAGSLGRTDAVAVRDAFDQFDRVLGVIALRRAEEAAPPVPVDEIERLIDARQAARRQRDFREADRIRDELDVRGILLEDSPAGTRWKRK